MIPRFRISLLTFACVLSVLAFPGQPAMAESRASSDSRPSPTRVFVEGNKGLGEVAFPLNKLVALPLNYRTPAQQGTP